MRSSESATSALLLEKDATQRELDALRAANAELEKVARARACGAEAAEAQAVSLREALEAAEGKMEGTEMHNKEMVKSLKKLDIEVRELITELRVYVWCMCVCVYCRRANSSRSCQREKASERERGARTGHGFV